MICDTVKLIYFSPTQTTKKILQGIAQGMPINRIEHLDLTPPQSATQLLDEIAEELTILGAPVYAGRLPIEAVQRSASYLRKTWGEQIAGNLGMGLAFGLISLGTLAVGVILLVAAAATESAALIILVAVCLLLAFVAIALISSALSGVYAAAVYRYAAEGQSDGFFTPAMVKSAFRARPRGRD